MKDVFAEVNDDRLHRAADSTNSSPMSPPTELSQDGHICPFCGLAREITADFDASAPCPRCTLADTPTTRNATKARIGPWHVRQVRNPWAPGMRFETLLALVKRGQVTRDSIVRGPTTHQLWKRASEIKGLSREFGVCHSCGGEIEKTASLCPHCNRLQEPPVNPDVLVEGRELLASRETPRETSREMPSPTTPPDTTPRETTPRNVAPLPLQAPPRETPERAVEADDPHEPAQIDIGSVAPPPSDEMLSAVNPDEVALARQITARPPVRTRPLRPVAPGADDALLTPQELAQAFQLNFAPEPTRRSGLSKRTVAVVLVLLLGAGVAALMLLRPDYREAVGRWTSNTWRSMTSFVSSRTTPSTPVERSAPVIADATEESVATRPAPIVIAPPPAPEPRAVEVAEEPAESSPLTTAPVAPVPDPERVASVKIAEPAPPPPVVEIAPPEPAPRQPEIEMPDGTPEEQARALWGQAIDAEANQDYVEAVRCYELIRTLPRDVQPWGLEVRLEQARRLAK